MGAQGEPASTGSYQTLRKLRLSGGPAGRLGLTVALAVIALAAIAWPAGDAIRFFCAVGVAGLTIFSILKVLRHASENPANASLDGAEITHYQHCLGTKAEPKILPSEIVADVLRRSASDAKGSDESADAVPTPDPPAPEPEPSATPEKPGAPRSGSATESQE